MSFFFFFFESAGEADGRVPALLAWGKSKLTYLPSFPGCLPQNNVLVSDNRRDGEGAAFVSALCPRAQGPYISTIPPCLPGRFQRARPAGCVLNRFS